MSMSVKHVLHTFRPEERLGELRLGLEESPPPPPPPPLQQAEGGETADPPTGHADGAHGAAGAAGRGGDGGGGADRRLEEREGPRQNGSRRVAEGRGRVKGVVQDGERHPADRREDDSLGEAGDGDGGSEAKARQTRLSQSQPHAQGQASMWRSRWIYRDRRSPAMEPDELQVEVSEHADAGCYVHVGRRQCSSVLLQGLEKGG